MPSWVSGSTSAQPSASRSWRDVDRVGEQDGAAGGEGLDDGDAEVLLVRGKDEGFAGGEGAPFGVAEQQAGPVDAVGAA